MPIKKPNITTKAIHQHKFKVDHPIEFAFNSSDGKKTYYQFTNPQSLYYERFMAIQDRLLEVEQMVTKDYLKLHTKLVKEALNKKEVDVQTIGALNFYLEQRLNYVNNVENLFNMCSVWYFDQDENPYTYDVEHADTKVKLWAKDKEALSFFLQVDWQRFLPSPTGSKENFLLSSRVIAKEELATLEYLSLNLLKGNVSSDTMTSLTKRMERLKELIALVS